MQSGYQQSDPFASAAFDSLRSFVQENQERGAEVDFEEFERELRERMCACEAELVGEQLQQYDVDEEQIEIEGEVFRRKDRHRRTYCGLAGEFSVDRCIYVPRGGGRAVCPLELRAGIVENHWTPRAARLMARAVGCAPPREAADFFEELGGMTPSTSSLDRIPKRLSSIWENKREDFENELREQEVVPSEATTVAVSIDGVYVPTKAGNSAKKSRSKEAKLQGPAGFREVECGAVSLYNDEGERLQTTRYGRKPEQNKATLKSQVQAELQSILNVRPDLRVVALADGARENWEYFKGLAESLGIELIEVVDFFHVCERMKTGLDAYHGEQSADSKAHFEQWKVWLKEDRDGAERVIRALKYRRDRSSGWRLRTVEAQLRYFRRYRERMRYKDLLDQDLPIGSGVVEAACKTLATERLKRSGMSWSLPGIQAVLTIRSLLQSNRWPMGWALLAAHYKRDVKLHVEPFVKAA